MALKSSIIISLIVHSLLFIKLWGSTPKTAAKQVPIKLDSKITLSEKTLTTRNKEKTNTIPTQKPNKNSNTLKASYYKKLISFVQSKAVYPKSALSLKQEGTVIMTLTLAKNGDVIDFEITKKSDFNSLNFATLRLAQKIKRYQPLPEGFGAQRVFKIPVNYILN